VKETALFFLYLIACLALAALLTVPIVQAGWLDYSPQRIMGRVAQLLILLGLWPFLRWRGLASRAALGYAAPRRDLVQAAWKGWLVGVAMLLVLVFALLILQIRTPDLDVDIDAAWLITNVARALIAGLLIGILEETFFRGALYAGIRRAGGLIAAVAWSSLLYALLHVMKPTGLPAGVPFDWTGSVQMALGVFAEALQWSHLDSVIALCMVGVLLALVREHTGHIGWCIGLHAGWVFVIQLTRRLTDGNEQAGLAFLVGEYDGVIGWLAAAWILVLTLVWLWASRSRVRP
jgi:membrane protease YdiL (CAAX protease family)